MAILSVRDEETVLTQGQEIAAFLEPYGLTYEAWDISRLERDASPVENEHERILTVFAEEIEQLKQQKGYVTADVIHIKPDTPNLDAMLAKFDKEHLHTEDEVRFVVAGRGVFTVHGPDDRVFDVEVHPGDLLVVPTNTWHWFTLCEDRTITCIRLFEDTSGWTPHYREGGMRA